MNKKNKSFLLTLIIVSIFHIIMGTLVIIFAKDSFEKNNIFIGSILIASSVPSILIYFLGGRYHNRFKIPYNFFAMFGIAAGIAFIVNSEIAIATLCIIWGVYDIVRSCYEIFDASMEVRENKLEIVEIVCALAELAFGILLCIHLEEGIYIHLVVMGISLILVGVKHGLDLINDS